MKLVKESLLEFERGVDPKELLGIGYVPKLKKDLDELYNSVLRSFNHDIKIIEEDKIILVWFKSDGRLGKSIISDMLDTFDYRIEEILDNYGLKLELSRVLYDAINRFENKRKYKFHRDFNFNGVIKEYNYTEK